jgi:hypothetical protein
MKVEGKSTRFHERTPLVIPVEVKYNEDNQTAWDEETQTEEITICGGGFRLSRPVEPNRLIHLKMPLPERFRLFDHRKEYYDVWGVVRYVRLTAPNIDGKISLKIGAALTGAAPPRSFLSDPTTLYDLKPILRRQSLWDLRELPRRTGRYTRTHEERRPIETIVILDTVGDDGRIIETVLAETENISESGIALKVKLSTECPNYVVVNTINKSLSILAKVRGAGALGNNYLRLHLEFISGKWFV